MTEESTPQEETTPQAAQSAADQSPREETAPVEKSNFKDTITFDDFMKLDLRVAKIIEVSEHPNADKLIVLKIDLGCEVRQIIAGIKAYYSPESLLGKEIVVVANLAPRKMRGLESAGMLLAASDENGDDRQVILITPDAEIAPGSTVG